MITVSDQLQLKTITISDQPHLIQLMRSIYPPIYKHLWVNEDCNWYLDSQYSKTPLKKDLETPNTDYYFLINNKKPIGILRIIWDYAHKEAKNSKAVKLHRIYIDPEYHSSGYGKLSTEWVINKAKQKEYDYIWLEVMDSQQQAMTFYKRIGFEEVFSMRLPFKRIHKSFRGMHTMSLVLKLYQINK